MSSRCFQWWCNTFPPLEESLQGNGKIYVCYRRTKINYLRSFTRGEVQRVVDNFRKRQQNDPVTLLQDLWKELETRFGSAAVITNALLERLNNLSNFQEKDHAKLQEFADLCADLECQIDNLRGLACLNYPGAIRPIVEKLPASLRAKWEKEIVKHAETHHDEYPGFKVFTRTVRTQAKIKNHPNILAGSLQKPVLVLKKGHQGYQVKVLVAIGCSSFCPALRHFPYKPFKRVEAHDFKLLIETII